MKVTPHPAFVAHVRARRGPLDFAPPLKPTRTSAVWDAFDAIENLGGYFVNRVKNEEPTRQAILMGHRRALADDLRIVSTAERLMWRLYGHDDDTRTLVRVVADELGVAKMVEMKLASSTIEIVEKEARFVFDSPNAVIHDASWDLARAIVCRADEPSYAAARAFAAAWREKRPVVARVLADFLFPSETAWANEDIDELLPTLTATPNLTTRADPLLTVTDDPARALAVLDQLNDYALWSFAGSWSCDLAVTLPPADAVRVLCKLLEKAKRAGKTQLQVLGAAMCALEGEEMASELAGLLLHSPIGPLAVDYFKRFPDLARAVLPKVASGTSKAADAARSILAASASKDDVPLADASEVPRVLRETPWRKRKKPKPVALDVQLDVPPTTVVWKDGERDEVLKSSASWLAQNVQEMKASDVEEWERLAREHRPVDVWYRWGAVRGTFRVPEKRALAEWNSNTAAQLVLGPMRMLAVHGDGALPGLFAREAFTTEWNHEALFEAQLHAIGRESAVVAAHAFARRKAWKKRAQEWLVEHAQLAAKVLLPIALGADSRERKDAEAAVRMLARTQRAAVDEAARALGGDATRAATDLVDRDPLLDLDAKGKLPPFIVVSTLPFVKTKSGKRLPDDAVDALLEILRSTTPDAPYAGLESIREELDEASLGEFTWALVQSWILAGAKGTYEWVAHALALVGNDACARRLAPYVRDWARKDAKKAKLAVDVLAELGSPAALLHLSYVADKSRFEEAKTHAKETLEQVAAAQGLTTDELADRTVPDLELDANGTATLDFGPRAFTVTFDEGLHPVIQTADGARVPTFPRPTKTDDKELAKAASARFKGLKADAETVAQALLRRFETAMVRGRTWSAPAFREFVVGHPLVTHLARRLVWSTPSGAFRVAEDGSLAGSNDAEYTLPDDATVTLPHPLALGADAVAAWSRILSDYAVVQPFEQMGRATYSVGDDAKATKLERFANRKSKAGALIGSLESRGWHKWADETSLSYAGKTVRTKAGGEGTVTLSFSPGIELGDIAGSPEQVFHAPGLQSIATFGDVHPVDYSEVVRDLEWLCH